MIFKTSNYLIASESLDGSENPSAKRLVFSTRKGMGISVSNHVWNLMNSDRFSEIPDHLFNVLMYHELVIPEDEDELVEVATRNLHLSNDVKPFITIFIKDRILDENFRENVKIQLENKIADHQASYIPIGINFRIFSNSITEGKGIIEQIEAFKLAETFPKVSFSYELICKGNEHESVTSYLPAVSHGIGKLTLILTAGDDPNSELTLRKEVKLLYKHFENYEDAREAVIDIRIVVFSLQFQAITDIAKELESLKTFPNVNIILSYSSKQHDEPEGEKQLVQFLAENKLGQSLLPMPKYTYVNKEDESGSLVFDEFSLYPERDTYQFKSRIMFDQPMFDKLIKGSIRCSTCVFFPLCGGNINKVSEGMDGCPSFVNDFMTKAKLKYGLLNQ